MSALNCDKISRYCTTEGFEDNVSDLCWFEVKGSVGSGTSGVLSKVKTSPQDAKQDKKIINRMMQKYQGLDSQIILKN